MLLCLEPRGSAACRRSFSGPHTKTTMQKVRQSYLCLLPPPLPSPPSFLNILGSVIASCADCRVSLIFSWILFQDHSSLATLASNTSGFSIQFSYE
jgi:hypothetical protein